MIFCPAWDNFARFSQNSSWKLSQPRPLPTTGSGIYSNCIEPSNRYVLTYDGSFYYSSDDGVNWEVSSAFDGPDAHYFYGSTIWASQSTPGMVIIGGSGYSNPPVYISYDHGASFFP